MVYETQVLKADDCSIALAAQLLEDGDLVAIPTETVYGLAANAFCENAVENIFRAKGRPQDNPLIVHIASLDMLDEIAENIPDDVGKLANAFWPGALTMIMPRKNTLAPSVSAGLATVAVRMPQNEVALEIIKKSGLPIAAPSANLSGSPSPTTAKHVFEDLDGRISLIIDGGKCEVGVESTVVDLTGDLPCLLRPGYITAEQISAVLEKEVAISKAVLSQLEQGEKAASPGMKYKHYSPKAKIIMVVADTEKYIRYVNSQSGDEVYALCFDDETEKLKKPYVTYGNSGDAKQQAQGIFYALRKLDAHGAKTVYAHSPQKNGVGLAVYNRLIRAAAFNVVEL